MTSSEMKTPQVTDWIEVCPAKINLRLSVLGKRPDGYHELRSVVGLIGLVDRLHIRWEAEMEEDRLECSADGLTEEPGDNLVMRALKVYRRECPMAGGFQVRLEKRIPVGAGLGGGSSDAAGMLRGLQAMCGHPLTDAALIKLGTELGADVPLFLRGGFSLMSGIGDILEPAEGIGEWMRGYRIAVIKPWWSVNTAWAYRALAEMKGYTPEERIETVEDIVGKKDLRGFLKNDFRRMVDDRYPTNQILYDKLNERRTVYGEMSGSGSAGFVLFETTSDWEYIRGNVRDYWGEEAQCEEVAFM